MKTLSGKSPITIDTITGYEDARERSSFRQSRGDTLKILDGSLV